MELERRPQPPALHVLDPPGPLCTHLLLASSQSKLRGGRATADDSDHSAFTGVVIMIDVNPPGDVCASGENCVARG